METRLAFSGLSLPRQRLRRTRPTRESELCRTSLRAVLSVRANQRVEAHSCPWIQKNCSLDPSRSDPFLYHYRPYNSLQLPPKGNYTIHHSLDPVHIIFITGGLNSNLQKPPFQFRGTLRMLVAGSTGAALALSTLQLYCNVV